MRLSSIDGKTHVFCVLGHPIGHSLSPAMQNAALQEMGLNGVYVAFDVAPEVLGEAVEGLQALGIGGVNCTIPHKVALIPLMDELTEEAAFIGAVNTIVFREGKRYGHNTDAPGFLAALKAAGVDPAGKRALVLGAGGSARAVTVALAKAGARLTVANRTLERAQELQRDLNRKIPAEAGVEAVPWSEEALRPVVKEAELLVNTTSLGMHPRVEEMPPVPPDAVHENLFVYDLIYNPLETRLLRMIRQRGAQGTHGAGMLAHQGAQALELWTGKPAPAELMERIIIDTLERRG